jgi:DNA-binding transcriptional MocR family regulator
MAPEPVTGERAYALLRSDILSGRLAPGASIVERQLASEYGMSISPLRDAAHRLAGERIVELMQSGGYRVPQLTAAALRDLYAWHSHLVRLIVKYPSHIRPPTLAIRSSPGTPGAAAVAATAVFRSLAASAQNEEFGRALGSANDRLAATRVFEAGAMANLDQELAGVIAAICGSGDNRFAVLWAYHRRRIRRADKISALMENARNA